MKPKAEPCLRDYLTIHVPASTLMSDRSKRRRQIDQMINPLMNKKLQAEKKSDVAIFYSTLPSRSFGKRKKMQSIPLLSNIKLNQQSKFRVVKDLKKSQYNFVFQKNRQQMERIPKQGQIQHKRMISTSHSIKTLPRNLNSHETHRKSTVSIGINQVIHRKFEPLSAGTDSFLTNNLSNKKLPKFQGIELSGSKAHMFHQHSPHKLSIQHEFENLQQSCENGVYIYD